MAPPITLKGLHPEEYEHPFDRKAMDSLSRMPGLETLVRQFGKLWLDRLSQVESVGSGLRIVESVFPDIHGRFKQACDVLSLSPTPDLFLVGGSLNGMALGIDRPFIRITSEAASSLSEGEMLFLLGHEIGHVKSRHTLYHTIGHYSSALAAVAGMATLGASNLVSVPLQVALFHWIRMSEFTADRAGLLACQDMSVCIRMMLQFAGVPRSHLTPAAERALLSQAREFQSMDYDRLNQAARLLSQMYATHPWIVLRAAELLKWHRSGQYTAVISRETQVYAAVAVSKGTCARCGFRMKGNERFCPSCGSAL